jgi:hypothetical protein
MVADTRRRKSTRLRGFWQNSNLSIILSALFLVSWGLQTWAGWVRFSASQEEHPQVADVFGQSGYVFEWLSTTVENWQSFSQR